MRLFGRHFEFFVYLTAILNLENDFNVLFILPKM